MHDERVKSVPALGKMKHNEIPSTLREMKIPARPRGRSAMNQAEPWGACWSWAGGWASYRFWTYLFHVYQRSRGRGSWRNNFKARVFQRRLVHFQLPTFSTPLAAPSIVTQAGIVQSPDFARLLAQQRVAGYGGQIASWLSKTSNNQELDCPRTLTAYVSCITTTP